MVFSSVQFIFYFLPLVVALYFAAPWPLRNAVLLVASLVFYTWGAGEFVSILLFSILFNFAMGLVIGKAREQEKERKRNALVAFDIIVNLSLLGYYKYFSFGAEQFSAMWKTLGFEPLTWSSVALPIGISFFTFHGLSYCVDVARGRNRAACATLSISACT